LANNHPAARGEIQIQDDRITIAVTRSADVFDFLAGAG
jgi:flagellar motor switch protein FliN/FliY